MERSSRPKTEITTKRVATTALRHSNVVGGTKPVSFPISTVGTALQVTEVSLGNTEELSGTIGKMTGDP